MAELRSLQSFLQAFMLVSLLLILRWIYRLTLHPLAKFPGPKLAAMTSLYAMSYDLPIETSYIKEFPKWHEQHGPVIRIEPNHLHIRDMDAYNQVFKIGTKFNRDPAIYGFPFTKGSFFNKLSVKEAKPHRDMYFPYFSRAAVNKLEPILQEHVSNFLTRLGQAASDSRPVDLSLGFRCLTADSLMRYSYDRAFGALDAPDFKFPMIVAIESFFDNSTFTWYLPTVMGYVVTFISTLPRSWIQWNKPFAAALSNIDGCEERLQELQQEPTNESAPNVFQTALDPKLEKGHPSLSLADMSADALVFFTAGTDTTAHALVTGTWNLLNNKSQMDKLRGELFEAIPDPNVGLLLDWPALEKLDYLRAVVKESIRLSYGVPGKIPRQVPPEGATLCGEHIPGGTMVSMACYVYHNYDEYFPDASQFKPERWLDPSQSADLEKKFISFSRGSRGCIGTNLAYAELFYTFAYLIRSFELELFETTRRDMEWHDAFVVATFGHLKVKARKVER